MRSLSRLLQRRPKIKCLQEAYVQAGGRFYMLDLGQGQVPVSAITGTALRCREVRSGFRPRRRRMGEPSIAQMKRRLKKGKPTPPVRLAKLDTELYVIEGHAQVAAAKLLHLERMEAHVLAYAAPGGDMEGLLHRERDEFEHSTGLQEIKLGLAGRYTMLLEQIRAHHAYLERARRQLFPFPEAVADWWQNIYRPVMFSLERDKVLGSWPDLTPDDIYALLTEYLEKEAGYLDLPLTQAIRQLLERPGANWQDVVSSVLPPCLLGGVCPYS